MKRFAMWLVKRIDPRSLILWNLDPGEYLDIREYMIHQNRRKEIAEIRRREAAREQERA